MNSAGIARGFIAVFAAVGACGWAGPEVPLAHESGAIVSGDDVLTPAAPLERVLEPFVGNLTVRAVATNDTRFAVAADNGTTGRELFILDSNGAPLAPFGKPLAFDVAALGNAGTRFAAITLEGSPAMLQLRFVDDAGGFTARLLLHASPSSQPPAVGLAFGGGLVWAAYRHSGGGSELRRFLADGSPLGAPLASGATDIVFAGGLLVLQSGTLLRRIAADGTPIDAGFTQVIPPPDANRVELDGNDAGLIMTWCTTASASVPRRGYVQFLNHDLTLHGAARQVGINCDAARAPSGLTDAPVIRPRDGGGFWQLHALTNRLSPRTSTGASAGTPLIVSTTAIQSPDVAVSAGRSLYIWAPGPVGNGARRIANVALLDPSDLPIERAAVRTVVAGNDGWLVIGRSGNIALTRVAATGAVLDAAPQTFACDCYAVDGVFAGGRYHVAWLDAPAVGVSWTLRSRTVGVDGQLGPIVIRGSITLLSNLAQVRIVADGDDVLAIAGDARAVPVPNDELIARWRGDGADIAGHIGADLGDGPIEAINTGPGRFLFVGRRDSLEGGCAIIATIGAS